MCLKRVRSARPWVGALLAAAAFAAAAGRDADAQALRGYTTYGYIYRCGETDTFERYLTTRTIDEAVARMFWLDRGGCRVLRFVREGESRNLWPAIRGCLAEREANDRAVAAGASRPPDQCRFDEIG
jgi:hypothetical protein